MLRPREVIVEHNYIHPFKSRLNFRWFRQICSFCKIYNWIQDSVARSSWWANTDLVCPAGRLLVIWAGEEGQVGASARWGPPAQEAPGEVHTCLVGTRRDRGAHHHRQVVLSLLSGMGPFQLNISSPGFYLESHMYFVFNGQISVKYSMLKICFDVWEIWWALVEGIICGLEPPSLLWCCVFVLLLTIQIIGYYLQYLTTHRVKISPHENPNTLWMEITFQLR